MSPVPPQVRDAFNEWARERRQWLTPYWEHPACVKCAHCHEPLELTWSNSAIGHQIYHGTCFEKQTLRKRKTHART